MAAPSSDTSPVLRLTFLAVVVIGIFIALFARLWFLQVLAGDRFVELADSNRLRTVVTEAPRGSILGSQGEELVVNRPALAISADRQLLLDNDGLPRDEEAELVIARLGSLLELDSDEVIERLRSQRRSPLSPVPLEFDVAPEIVFSVREHQELFPGVVAETLPVREYPFGELAAHMMGYLTEIGEAELLDPAFTDYRGGDLIGRGGLEQSYEQVLRGVAGQRRLVVNARGDVLDVQSEREPIQGNDLVTTLDVELQEATERLLVEGIEASRSIQRDDGEFLPSVAGSAVVLDARTGAVLAMASYPSYDPRRFVGGVSSEYWDFVNDRENFQPLVNRAVSGLYPPGSVFKTATGAAWIEAGLIGPRGTRNCDAAFEVGGNTYRNWNRGVNEGPMDLSDALMRSCDTYFYDLAYNNWLAENNASDADEVLVRVAQAFGFGRTLGIDLPAEPAGRIPGRQWREDYHLATRDRTCAQAEQADPGSYERELLTDLCQFGGVWRGGDAINASIGQGDVITTPLQVAASYQALANDGVLMRPHLGARVLAPDGTVVEEFEPESLGDVGMDAQTLAVMREGLERTVMDPRGTGFSAFSGFPLADIPVAGKTGTAEVRPRIPFAWFAGYAPANDPEIVVAVNVEEGGGGSQTAAPIARNIMEVFFGVSSVEEAEFEAGEEILD
ncbi:MAG: penicillin-binding protein 2 [Nitriliruptoraceae bacterium]|nr:penicillin-binding protein 2 [Nitriliruptoraceae bacterium]